jgi:hypothetical protein
VGLFTPNTSIDQIAGVPAHEALTKLIFLPIAEGGLFVLGYTRVPCCIFMTLCTQMPIQKLAVPARPAPAAEPVPPWKKPKVGSGGSANLPAKAVKGALPLAALCCLFVVLYGNVPSLGEHAGGISSANSLATALHAQVTSELCMISAYPCTAWAQEGRNQMCDVRIAL